MLLIRRVILNVILVICTVNLIETKIENRIKRFTNWNQQQIGWNDTRFKQHQGYPNNPNFNRNNTNPRGNLTKSIPFGSNLTFPTRKFDYPIYNNQTYFNMKNRTIPKTPQANYNRTATLVRNVTKPVYPKFEDTLPDMHSNRPYFDDGRDKVPLAPYSGQQSNVGDKNGRLYPNLNQFNQSLDSRNSGPPPYNDLTKLTYGGGQINNNGSRSRNVTYNPYALRRKRNVEEIQEKSYHRCLTPNGEEGHCKLVSHCKTEDFESDLWKVFDNICIIERSKIGVCCPDPISSDSKNIKLRKIVNIIINKDTNDDDDDITPPRVSIDKPEERGCGVSALKKTKITGGRKSKIAEFPWMAALKPLTDPKAICGGVLITDRHILTAAHCVDALKPRQLRVRLGEYDFTKDNETLTRDFSVSEIRVHIDFNPITYENDIAVIKLRQSTTFNTYIWPICMPPIDTNWENYVGVVTGWGTQFYTGPISKVLMKVEVPIWNNQACQDVYTANKIYDTVLCAGEVEGGKDACQGDSGGPLMVKLPNDRWVVAGIVSYGMRCGVANRPGVYTRVNSYTKWIIENSVFL
uniref:Phenoloxidase-activating factor 2 n=1 Tax=Culicoides sonorensis TaxID=179676 RepID=A0A336MUZ5_CULSO